MRFLFRTPAFTSGKEAKKRLSAVIKSDRINLRQGAVIEKIRKEVLDVLIKFSGEDAPTPEIKISCTGEKYILNAQINR